MNLDRASKRAWLLGAAGLGALAIVLFVWARGGGESPAAPTKPIAARTDVSPRRVLFGDTLTALVEVTVDRSRVDPRSVRLDLDFAPWKPIADPEVVRRDRGLRTSIRTTYLLRCLTSGCIRTDEEAVLTENFPVTFGQARITYTATGETGRAERASVQEPWPRFLVDARFSARDAQEAGTSLAGWRADLDSMPAVTYSIAPGLLFALLLAVGALLTIVAAAFAHRTGLLRRPSATPSADPPRAPVLPALEQALALLEDPARVNGTGEQRRALELVAAGMVERGDAKLGRAARSLAWSPPVPGFDETSALAARARSVLGQELHANSA